MRINHWHHLIKPHWAIAIDWPDAPPSLYQGERGGLEISLFKSKREARLTKRSIGPYYGKRQLRIVQLRVQ